MKRNMDFHFAFKNAFDGLKYTFRTQRNVRIHVPATIIVVLMSAWLKISLTDWALITVAIGLVWVAEMFNTALECYFDLVEPNENNLVKAGKDTSAAAVLLTSCVSIVIGVFVLGPALIEKIRELLL